MTKRNPQGGLLDRIAYANPRETPDPRDILSSLGEVVYDWDLISDKLRWGPNVDEVLGSTGERTFETGAAYADCITTESAVQPRELIMRSRESDAGSGVRYQIFYGLKPNADSPRQMWVEDIGRWFGGADGRPARAHGVLRVVNCRTDPQERPAHVNHDPLTGCLSRARFIDLTAHMFGDSARKRGRGRCGLMLIALEGVADINQVYGYDTADQLIAGVGRRLSGLLRAGDLIARYAGAKFAVALSTCDSAQLEAAARRLIDGVAEETYTTEAGRLRSSVSVGGSLTPLGAGHGQSIFLQAEEALEAARPPAGSGFVAYRQNAARENARRRTRVAAEQIVAALNDKRVMIAIEPVVDAATRRVAFYEALMRMRLEDGSWASTASIFDAAEKAGLAPLLDQRVMELALAQLGTDASLVLSVNVSSRSLREEDWPNRMRAILSAHPGCAERLIMEITETCVIEDIEATQARMTLMQSLGARVAMDDFGAGHTSFKNLRNLKFDFIKIDGAFIQNLARSADDRFFVRTLVDLAHHVGVATIAEWVADEESARLLREWGVDFFQGELFGMAKIVEQPRAESNGAEVAA